MRLLASTIRKIAEPLRTDSFLNRWSLMQSSRLKRARLLARSLEEAGPKSISFSHLVNSIFFTPLELTLISGNIRCRGAAESLWVLQLIEDIPRGPALGQILDIFLMHFDFAARSFAVWICIVELPFAPWSYAFYTINELGPILWIQFASAPSQPKASSQMGRRTLR